VACRVARRQLVRESGLPAGSSAPDAVGGSERVQHVGGEASQGPPPAPEKSLRVHPASPGEAALAAGHAACRRPETRQRFPPRYEALPRRVRVSPRLPYGCPLRGASCAVMAGSQAARPAPGGWVNQVIYRRRSRLRLPGRFPGKRRQLERHGPPRSQVPMLRRSRARP
jgi:hypothetical protein